MQIEKIIKNTSVNDSGCWVWQKSCNSAGYGQLTENKRYWLAHRYSYFCTHPETEETCVIRHMCHNTKCCNPLHLVSGSQRDNYYDSYDNHKQAAERRRGTWCVEGVFYNTLREASNATGIHANTIMKYTKEGVFDLDSYKIGCLQARRTPKL